MAQATLRLDDPLVAAELLAAGRLVAFPTETVYGLGADAASPDAVTRVFAAKGRPPDHPLIVHLGSSGQLSRWSPGADARAQRLAEVFWPGPLTIVVPRGDSVCDQAVGGRTTVGLRVPDHPLTQRMLAEFGGGVVGPSANRFGRVSPTTADHVLTDLDGRIDAVLDGGPCRVGVESTIVEVLVGQPVRLLRPGGIGSDEVEDALGEAVLDDRGGASRAAGMLASHYAPRASVHVVSEAPTSETARGVVVVDLGDDSVEAARRLYAALREADSGDASEIVVVAPTGGRLLEAVIDRLSKAAAPRPE